MQEHLAGQVLGVAEHVLGRVDTAGRDFGIGKHLHQPVQRQAVGPAIDHAVQLVAPGVAAIIAGQARVVGQVGAADGLHEALEDGVTVGADLHMLAVGAGVDGGGRDTRHDVAGALADKTEHVELRDHAFHHGENGLVQRHIHHLALAAIDFAMTQGHQRANHSPQRGDRVADGDAGAHRRAVVETGDVTQPAHRFTDRTEARLVLHRAGLAEAGQAHHHQARV